MIIKINKAHLRFSKKMAGSETTSSRQIKNVSEEFGGEMKPFTDEERKKLRRGQFAFGSAFPYIFDGLANAATHCPELFQKTDKMYYVLELPIDDLCHLSLMNYEKYNREHFIHELLRRDNTPDKEEAKHFRYIQIDHGDYVSAQPLVVMFRRKSQDKISPEKLKSIMNLKTYNEHTNVINSVLIYVLKALINPIFDGYPGGWFSCPNALHAKIVHTLHTLTPLEINNESKYPFQYCIFDPIFLRKYFLYLNIMDGSQKTSYIDVNAIDLWEHVAPSQINASDGRLWIRNQEKARWVLESANRFFSVMETRGLMEGAKAFPTTQPKGVYYDRNKQKYRIYYKRSPGIISKKKGL